MKRLSILPACGVVGPTVYYWWTCRRCSETGEMRTSLAEADNEGRAHEREHAAKYSN